MSDYPLAMFIAKRCFIAGRVQGVFYRASTQQKARKLGVVGYARNLTDGRVEVLAIGELAQVDALVQWLWRGPPASQVTRVDITELNLAEVVDIPIEFAIA